MTFYFWGFWLFLFMSTVHTHTLLAIDHFERICGAIAEAALTLLERVASSFICAPPCELAHVPRILKI